MSDFYVAKRITATRMLTKRGSVCTYSKDIGAVQDGAAGTVTEGEVTDVEVYAIRFPAKEGAKKTSISVKNHDWVMYLAALNIEGDPVAFPPETGLSLVFGGTTLVIGQVEKLSTDGIVDVMYIIGVSG